MDGKLERFKKTWVYPFFAIMLVIFATVLFERNIILEAKNIKTDVLEIPITENDTASETAAPVPVKTTLTAPKSAVAKKSVAAPAVTVVQGQSLPVPPATVVPKKDTASVKIEGIGDYDVEVNAGDTAFDILKKAAADNGFALEYEVYSFGTMVTKIGAKEAEGSYYWAFYYNGAYATVGADAQKVGKDDKTEWRYETW